MRLPFCRMGTNPTFRRALMTSRHESRGSFNNDLNTFSFRPLPQPFRFNLQVSLNCFLQVASASSFVSPSEATGSSRHLITKPPSSAGSSNAVYLTAAKLTQHVQSRSNPIKRALSSFKFLIQPLPSANIGLWLECLFCGPKPLLARLEAGTHPDRVAKLLTA